MRLFDPIQSGKCGYELHRVYYAQREHWSKTGSFADSLDALKLDPATFAKGLRIERTSAAFQAELPAIGSARSRWLIDQDSWIRKIDPPKAKP